MVEQVSAGIRPVAPQMSALDWFLLILLGAIWGLSFVFGRVAVLEIHPLLVVFFRVAIAAAGLLLWLAMRRISLRPALPYIGTFFLVGLANNVIPFSLIFIGQTEIGAGLASVLNATMPFWTVLLASLWLGDEPLSANRLGGVVLGVIGTAIMVGPSAFEHLGGPLWPKLAVLGAAFVYAVGAILSRRLRGIPATLAATGQLAASTVIMLPMAIVILSTGELGAPSAAAWGSVVSLGLLCTAFAYILFFSISASAGATNVSLVTLIVPVSALILGALLLGESLDWTELAGMAIIGCGLITIDGRLIRAR